MVWCLQTWLWILLLAESLHGLPLAVQMLEKNAVHWRIFLLLVHSLLLTNADPLINKVLSSNGNKPFDLPPQTLILNAQYFLLSCLFRLFGFVYCPVRNKLSILLLLGLHISMRLRLEQYAKVKNDNYPYIVMHIYNVLTDMLCSNRKPQGRQSNIFFYPRKRMASVELFTWLCGYVCVLDLKL